MVDKKADHWLPLHEAAALMNRKVDRIRSQMRNGRIQRDVHFRRVGEGQFELNVVEYLRWVDEEKERRKLPFLERVRLSSEDHQQKLQRAAAPFVEPKPAPAPSAKRQPKLIPITVWAEQTFGEYTPVPRTLYSWAKAGRIHPMPTKIGRQYFVSPEAEYVDPVVQKIRRMVGGK